MISTKNNLPLKSRKAMVEVCNQLLADASDLRSQAKQAHWNVKGDKFIALHLLFDEIATALLPIQDEIAERAVQLGGEVQGTLRQAARASRLAEYLPGAAEDMQHVEALSSALASFGANLREGITAAEQAEDMATQDIFIEAARVVDKYTWFVEAHQQNVRAESTGSPARSKASRTASKPKTSAAGA